MIKLLAVGLGGFLGALARYGLSGAVQRHVSGTFPLGTLAVNVAGCALIGALMTVVEDRPALSAEVRLFLSIGLLGAFTTFSTVAHETFEMIRDRSIVWAAANIAMNVTLGLAAVWLGRGAVRLAGS